MKKWFNTKIKYQKQNDQGLLKLATESYLVDAVSFTEAEARITEIMAPEIQGEMIVSGVTKTNYSEIIFVPEIIDENWYKVKVSYVSLDSDSGKEKKVSEYLLVAALNPECVVVDLQEHFKSMLVPYEIESIVKTSIIDVYPFNTEE